MARPSTEGVLQGNGQLPAETQQDSPPPAPSPLQEKVADTAPASSAGQIPAQVAAASADKHMNGSTACALTGLHSQDGSTKSCQQTATPSLPNGDAHAAQTANGVPAVARKEAETAATTLQDMSAAQTQEQTAVRSLPQPCTGPSEAAGPSQPNQAHEAAASPQKAFVEGGATPETIAAVNEKYNLNVPYQVRCCMQAMLKSSPTTFCA